MLSVDLPVKCGAVISSWSCVSLIDLLIIVSFFNVTLLLIIPLWRHYMYGTWSWHTYSYAFGFLLKIGCDNVTPMYCSGGTSEHPMLKTSLQRTWHRLWVKIPCLVRCLWFGGIGSSSCIEDFQLISKTTDNWRHPNASDLPVKGSLELPMAHWNFRWYKCLDGELDASTVNWMPRRWIRSLRYGLDIIHGT